MRSKLYCLAALPLLALPLVHPFGDVRRAGPPLDAALAPPIGRACGNCHSERTQWPLASDLPVVSWMIERDVFEARRHLDFSRWQQYSADQKRDLLAGIAAEVRGSQMPPARYLLLHPADRLSESDRKAILDWTKAQRRTLRESRE